MNPISFTVPIAAQAVQTGGKRMVIVKGKPLFFKDKRTASYESALLLLARDFVPASPMDGPIQFTATFVMARPQGLMRRKDADGLIFAPKRPDFDNLVKGLLDPLSKLGFWRDDAQVTDAIVRKRYAEKTGTARIEISILQLTAAEGELL